MFGFTDDSDASGSTKNAMEAMAALTSAAHALTDFVLSSDERMAEFCAFISTDNDEEAANVRGNIQATHDAFAAFSARAMAQLQAMTQLSEFLGGMRGPDGPDDLDINIFRI
jgi:hypothetical protein